MTFSLHSIRYTYRAKDAIYFPPGKAGNVLRGGFGMALRDTAPASIYERIFEPKHPGGPSGLADPPRPFVFRAAHLGGLRFRAGDQFAFDLHVFDMQQPWLESYGVALDRLAANGLGPGRGRAFRAATDIVKIEVPLAPPREPVPRLGIRFLTPTELKSGETLAARPDFDILFARVRDRVATLASLYGAAPIDCDFRGMGERAAAVRMKVCRVREERVERRSTRTGQTHDIGGFVGEAVYEGDLGEFVPWLDAASWTGVGRQTVWGKGAISLDVISSGPCDS